MFIRFNAIFFRRQGKNWVSVYDHKTGRTLVFSLRQYHRISKYLSYHGGVIYGEEEKK